MSDSEKTNPIPFEIKVAPDRMSVTLAVARGAEVSASDIIAELRKMKIACFDDGWSSRPSINARPRPSVQGGIVGKQKGKFTVGGGLRCRFISGGLIVCAGDVIVQSDLTDSRIACAGKLTVAQGVLYGGAVAANGGITCVTLGHPSGTSSTVEAGAGIASRSFLVSAGHQIDLNRKRIKSVRATIEPLLQMMKSLNAQQREKVTELLYEADEMEAATSINTHPERSGTPRSRRILPRRLNTSAVSKASPHLMQVPSTAREYPLRSGNPNSMSHDRPAIFSS